MSGQDIDNLLKQIHLHLKPALTVVDLVQTKGYTKSFSVLGDKLLCADSKVLYHGSELQVDEIFFINDSTGDLAGYQLYVVRNSFDGIYGLCLLDASSAQRVFRIK